MKCRNLGRTAFEPVYTAMRHFTDSRTADTPDELWTLEHDPVFTLGLAANPANVIKSSPIPVVSADRGGEVTYHGPGQAIVYLLLDLKRRPSGSKLLVRDLVRRMEQAVIDVLSAYGITGERHAGAPGIFLADGDRRGAKIAALGLKVRSNGCTYHGLALNVAMDLEPFSFIHPCGYAGQPVIDMKTLGIDRPLAEVQAALVERLKLCLEST